MELHPKYVERRLDGRLTYALAIEYGNAELIGQSCLLDEADTFVDAESPWFHVRDISQNIVYVRPDMNQRWGSGGDGTRLPTYMGPQYSGRMDLVVEEPIRGTKRGFRIGAFRV